MVYFSRALSGEGQRVGTAPIMAKIECTGFPDGWFPLQHRKSMFAVNREMHDQRTPDGNTFIPTWLRAECFEYHWRALRDAVLERP